MINIFKGAIVSDKKFHINSKGEAKPCNASVRGCRFGDSQHYDTFEAAQQVSDRNLQQEYSSFSQPLKKNISNGKNRKLINRIKSVIGDNPQFDPDYLMNVGKVFDEELTSRIPFEIDGRNLSYEDYETIEKETHKLIREVMDVDENLTTEVYGSLAKDLNNAVKILPNSVKNGFSLKDIPILAKTNRIDNRSFSGIHQGHAQFKVNAPSQGVEVYESERERVKDLPDKAMYIDEMFLESDLDGLKNNEIGMRVKIKSKGSNYYKEQWLGKKTSSSGKKISDSVEVYVNGKLKKLDVPVYELKSTQILTGSIIKAQKTDGKNGSESVLLHEYTHVVQMTDSSKVEDEIFKKLAYDQYYHDGIGDNVYKGFPDDYMGLYNSREVLTRSTEGMYKPTSNGFLYGKDKGENADTIRRWVMGYWLSKDVDERNKTKKANEAIREFKEKSKY